MLKTNLDFVSRVSAGLNALDKDSRIPKRYILNLGREKAEFFLSQKLNDRSIFREDNLYTTIDCVELKAQEVVRCEILEFRRCKSIMKSKNKLPKLIYSRYGSSLKEVTTADDEREFKYTTPSQYRRDLQRSEKEDCIYYYVKDDYLYLIDTEIQLVNLYLITTQLENAAKVSSCGEVNECKSLWEYGFVVPDKMGEIVIAETIKELSLKKQIPADEAPNMNSNDK